jgi:hypothetical protein
MDKLLAILKLIPTIVGLVQVAETMIPGKGQGPAKLNLVLNTVNAAAQTAPDVVNAISAKDMNAAVTAIATAAVVSLNAAGVFAKSSS